MKKSDGTHIVGIDLGTTYSLVADVVDGKPVVLPNHLDELLTPSAVSIDETGVVLVGAAARARASRFPESSALAFKRDMGTRKELQLGKQTLSPVELSALVLGQLKADAEAALGAKVSEAVVTVPAYFGDAQRQATRDAARMAGLVVERIINEPTAAALAYGFHQRSGDEHVVVLDLGGGTFDVTLLQLTDGVIEVKSSAGDTRLGGEDFTSALADAHAQKAGLDRSSPKLNAVLVDACEDIKRELTHASRAVRRLTVGEQQSTVEFSRDDAELAWSPLLDRLRGPIEQALRDAKMTAAQVDQVLLVGGSTRLPCVVALARSVFDREPKMTLPQDEAVALGAAVQAALKIDHGSVEEIVATDIAPFSLGIKSMQMFRQTLVPLFTPILERGTVLPASRVEKFFTMDERQTRLRLEVFQGEHARVENNTRLGELEIEGLPEGRINEVAVRFTYDLNGILEVEVTERATGKMHALVLDPTTSHSKAAIDAARERFARLKVHPRETLPNRTALESGETLFSKLLGDTRTLLGSQLAAFRAELEGHDTKRIDAARKQLLELIRQLKDAPRD